MVAVCRVFVQCAASPCSGFAAAFSVRFKRWFNPYNRVGLSVAISAHIAYNLSKERVLGEQVEYQDNQFRQVVQALEQVEQVCSTFSYKSFSSFRRHQPPLLGARRLLRLAKRELIKAGVQRPLC